MRLQTALTNEEKTGGLGEIWLEIGPGCHMKCNFCFNSAGGCQKSPEQMPRMHYKNLLLQFALLGGKLVNIVGFGEPFFGPNVELTMFIIERAAAWGMRTHIFTSGDLITEDLIRELRGLPTSLGIKFNHFSPAVQDRLVGSRGYTERRKKVLGLLRENRFYGKRVENPKVSFVTSILPENASVVCDIWRYCRKNRIVPDIDTLLPLGRAKDQNETYEPLARKIFAKLREIDQKEFGIASETASPIYVDRCCDRCHYHLFVDHQGRVSPCVGANKKNVFLGDLNHTALYELWESPLMRTVRSRSYTGRCAECRSFAEGKCNSCLGRFAKIEGSFVHTIGCYNFQTTGTP